MLNMKIVAIFVGLSVAHPAVETSDGSTFLRPRQEAVWNTTIDLNDNRVGSTRLNGAPGEFPPTFTNLWNRITDECVTNSCQTTTPICEDACVGCPSEIASEVCMSLDGVFPRLQGQRDNSIKLAREMFDRTLVPAEGEGLDGYTYYEAVQDYISVVGMPESENAGASLIVRFTQRDTGSGSCPDAVNLIVAAGSLLPVVGPAFGVIGIGCMAAEGDRTTIE